MKLYELLDTLKPYEEIKIRLHQGNTMSILIATGFNWKNCLGWTYFATSAFDVHNVFMPQNENIHTITNTSGQAYPLVYKRWSSLIKRIKKDFKNIEAEKMGE